YGLFVLDSTGTPRLVPPAEARYRVGLEAHKALLDGTLAACPADAAPLRKGAAVPLCVPLALGGQLAGAVLIAELVPQVGERLGRLQLELVSLLAERLASSICLGSYHEELRSRAEPWAAAAAQLQPIEEG